MNITWVTRSFLDYRIPVYKEINRLSGNKLTVIYYDDVVPERCKNKLKEVIGDRAIGLTGEFRIFGKKRNNQSFANTGIRIPIQPGLIKTIKKTNPAIVLSDGFFQWSYATLAMNFFWNVPHIMCYERTKHTERNVTKYREYYRKIASKYINAICCNGTLTKEYLIEMGYPKNQLYLGNMAADSEELTRSVSSITGDEINKLKKNYNLNGKIFLYVGQLIERKGIIELIKNWKEFSNNNQEQVLILLGDGENRTIYEKYIAEKKIDNIILLGSVDYSLVYKFYAAADIFIISTLEDNWSLVVPEAMSCGLPILCSKYNGCWPELVKSENGWVFDPLDSSDFQKVLKNAWQKRESWVEMGLMSKEIVSEHSPSKIATQIYNTCLNIYDNQE